MTVYFPLAVQGAMQIEPTETESKEKLDRFIAVMNRIAHRAQARGPAALSALPARAPVRRPDEITAARDPKLRWRKILL